MCKQRHTSTLLVQERSLRSVALRVRATMVLQINTPGATTGNPSLESSDDPSGRDQRLDIRGQPPTRAHRQSQGKLATHIKRARPSLATSHSQLFGSPRGAFTHGASFRLRTGATEAAVLLLKSPTGTHQWPRGSFFFFFFPSSLTYSEPGEATGGTCAPGSPHHIQVDNRPSRPSRLHMRSSPR